jgi:hypothetical protein
MYLSDCTLARLPVQAMAISDVLCILGYLLITFSQVFPPLLCISNFSGRLDACYDFCLTFRISYGFLLFYYPFRIIGGLTLEGCRSDVE